MATNDPNEHRQDAQQRLRYLKYGAVGLTVAGLGAFTGLAVAGTSSGSDHPQGDHAGRQGSVAGEDLDHDGRVGDPGDGGYFDSQGYGGAVAPGSESGPGSAQGSTGSDGYGYADGYGYSDGYGQSQGSQGGYAPQGGYGQGGGGMPSQGSSGAS